MERTTKFEDVSPIKIQVIFQPAIVSLLEGMTYHLPFGGGPQHLEPHKSPWFGGDTVDGSEIQRSPVDMVVYPPLFTTFFIYPRWLFGTSEASTVCFTLWLE